MALMLAGCGDKSGRSVRSNSAAAPAATDHTTVTTVPEDESPPPAVNASDPAGDPPADTPSGQVVSPSAAAAVVQRYYAAIDRGDFRTAFALWGNDGADSRQSFADFKRGFAATAKTSVKTGKPTNGEGAAGSIYIDVPVTVRATLKDGKHQRFTGHYTLRRVNDVPGSTAAERRWHLSSAELKAG
jgi:hypothetical protein